MFNLNREVAERVMLFIKSQSNGIDNSMKKRKYTQTFINVVVEEKLGRIIIQ